MYKSTDVGRDTLFFCSTEVFLRAQRPPSFWNGQRNKPANQRGRPGTQRSLWRSSKERVWRRDKVPKASLSLQHSICLDECPEGLLLSKNTWKFTWCLHDSLTVGNKILRSDESMLELFVAGSQNIPKSWCGNLVAWYWRRLEAVIASKVSSTKHQVKTLNTYVNGSI